jgi:hypothetical protein
MKTPRLCAIQAAGTAATWRRPSCASLYPPGYRLAQSRWWLARAAYWRARAGRCLP